MRPAIRRAGLREALALAPVMREQDAREAERSSGLSAKTALVRSLARSRKNAWYLTFDGQPAAIFGLGEPELVGGVAVPWLLTGQVATRHPLAIVRLGRAVVDSWATKWPVLVQMVDAEHLVAQRLLRAWGFTIHPPIPHGPAGLPFCPAIRSAHV